MICYKATEKHRIYERRFFIKSRGLRGKIKIVETSGLF